jgi:hypothetical protein
MRDRIGQKIAREKRKQDAARAFPKGPTRKTLKGRKLRAEALIKRLTRALCVARDGICRARRLSAGTLVGPCAGQSQWAHYGAHKRARTRGMAPLQRHTTAGSLMLCARHHRQYDAGTMKITALTDRGCDGPLEFTC